MKKRMLSMILAAAMLLSVMVCAVPAFAASQKQKNGFMLGAATAAYQCEGNNIYSDCWAQENMKNTSYVEKSGPAVDHYHHYKEDIKMLADAGLNAYRFSIEWARIEPEENQFNEKEMQHYLDVIQCCKDNGVTPVVTLMHFSSPTWLIKKGGWDSVSTITYFKKYVEYVMQHIGSKVPYICTINEANMRKEMLSIIGSYATSALSGSKDSGSQNKTETANQEEGQKSAGVQVGINTSAAAGSLSGMMKENIQVFGTPMPATFLMPGTDFDDQIIIKCHQAAKDIIKKYSPNTKVGLTLSLHDIQAKKGGELWAKKAWNTEFTHYLPYIKDDDFIGVQNYTRAVYGPKGQEPNPAGAKLTQMDYEDYPQALEHVIRKVHESYKGDIVVTENGIATSNDQDRVAYIKTALNGVRACLKDGIPVKGYFYWSLLDNFEWQQGFSKTFGLISVDRSTMKRTAKPSLSYLGSQKI